MNKQEFALVLKVIKSSYPTSNAQFDETVISVWYEMLKDLDYSVCLTAVTNFAKNSKYMPTIADIREACSKEAEVLIKPYNEAWEDVLKVVRKYGNRGAKEAMEELDPLTRKAVKCLGFYDICTTTSVASLRREFKDIYNGYKEDADYNIKASSAIGNAKKGDRLIEQYRGIDEAQNE